VQAIDGLGEAAKVVTSDASSLLSLCRQASICTSEDSRGVDFIFGHDVITCRSTAPDVGESEIIGDDDENIGLASLRTRDGHEGDAKQENGTKDRLHGDEVDRT
jgi:hypothetical protein